MGEHVAGLADGTHYVINFGCSLGRGQVLDLVVRLVERGTYQVSHAGIKDNELLVAVGFHIDHACQQ